MQVYCYTRYSNLYFESYNDEENITMSLTMLLIVLIAAAVLPVPISLIVEALRRPPAAPATLYWDAGIPIQYADIDGMRIRYIKTGTGPNLVLLHTLRTQLDIFEKVVPRLARNFTLYALDYPGHGFSDIVCTAYRPELFVKTVEGFLDRMNVRETTIAGISIGGVIPLLMAAKRDPRVKKVIAINPYDYGQGRGVTRANLVAWVIFTLAQVPILGDTFMRLRNRMIERIILQGGVAFPQALTEGFVRQVYDSGLRKGHYRGFLNLIRNAHHWDEARRVYHQIQVPVLVIYGDRDWSHPAERQQTAQAIPRARVETVANGSHFLSMDQPERVAELIKGFALT